MSELFKPSKDGGKDVKYYFIYLLIVTNEFDLIFVQLSTTKAQTTPDRRTKRSWPCLKRTVRSFPT